MCQPIKKKIKYGNWDLQFEIEESLHIQWEKPTLNHKLNHVI